MNRLALASIATLALVAAPPALAQEADKPTKPVADAEKKASQAVGPAKSKVRIALKGEGNGKVDVGDRITGVGYVRPFVPGQEVKVWVARAAKVVDAKKVKIKQVRNKNQGRFSIRSGRLIRDGAYRVRARKKDSPKQEGFKGESHKVGVRYPDLDPGQHSNAVGLFNELLRDQAYFTSSGRGYSSATQRAVLAYRKVNGMPRSYNATPSIFRSLANGNGGYKLRYPGAGKHVETDLSRQVMVLASGGEAQHIFHISSGTAATPTIQGKHQFTRKQYGTNSLGMVHSVYFGPTNRGYATHGYKSVPTYPASHGCLRNPIPNSLFIYNWIDIGDTIYVYR